MSKIVNITISCQTLEAAELNLSGAKFRHEIYKQLEILEIVIAQEFTDEYKNRYENETGARIIGFSKRLGYVGARNAAFEYLYNSDYDYAILNDSRDIISKTSIPEFLDLVKVRMDDSVELPEFISMRNPSVASPTKYMNNIDIDKKFFPVKRLNSLGQAMSTSFLHFAIFPNFKKKFGKKFLIPDSLVQYVNGTEDCLVMQKIFDFQKFLWIASSICQSSLKGERVSMHGALNGEVNPKFHLGLTGEVQRKKYKYTEIEQAAIVEARKGSRSELMKLVNGIRSKCIIEGRFIKPERSNYVEFETEKFDLQRIPINKSEILIPRIHNCDEYIEKYHSKYVKKNSPLKKEEFEDGSLF